MFSIIVAYDQNRGIAKNGKLPWPHHKADMKRFVDITSTTVDPNKVNAVIMGRKTWDSINPRYKPLSNRINVVLTRGNEISDKYCDNVYTFNDFNVALAALAASPSVERIFVIGGQDLYNLAIYNPMCQMIYTTVFTNTFDADKFFPEVPWFKRISSEKLDDNAITEVYQTRLDILSPEYQYLNLLHYILTKGDDISEERTGVGTLSVDGAFMKFPITTLNPHETLLELEYRVPIMTSKTLFTRGVFEELIMFLRGDTNVRELQKRGVKIWDDNTSRKWLDSHNLRDYEVGETGPFYGFQWNFFGADYLGPDARDEHAQDLKGVNQLEKCIQMLKTDPYSRRIVLSAWNPLDLSKMCLPPCHIVYIFKVSPPQEGTFGRKILHCTMLQRSGDMFLGIPFNIFSTTLLTIFMSRAADMLPGNINITISDAHIYKNHITQVTEQLTRTPYVFPILKINAQIDTLGDMRALSWNNIEIKEYHKWPAIKGEMAV